MSRDDRQYECIVLGATGYTGKYTAQHIATSLPTDFRWAVAGRSQARLQAVADELKQLSPDRKQPDIITAQLEKDDLVRLAKSTKILITTVGPYVKYGTLVVEACAETGTHYLDVTGEVPWTLEMVRSYHDTAKKSGAIMIMQDGMESAPSDLLCWALVSHIREALHVGTKEVILSMYDISATPSGGSTATIMGMFDDFTITQMKKAQDPWSLCPVSPCPQGHSKSWFESITGARSDVTLGMLTDNPQGISDLPIVHRSWGLFDGGKMYGPNFKATAYMSARNVVTAFVWHVALTALFTALALPPVRWLLKNFIYKPGEGPTKE
jgi:short subunit dehydrogenase-like uncharacterized protein